MNRSIEQQQRRIEMVGMAALNPKKYTIGDFAIFFGIDDEMVKKDLKALRSEGIAIHQLRKQGISIVHAVQPALLEFYLQHYMLLSKADSRKDRLLTQMVRKKGLFAVGLIVSLQRGIRDRFKVEFEYVQTKGFVPYTYFVDPLLLFQREGLWRLLAQMDGKIMQFHIAKIVSIKPTNKRFSRPEQQIIDAQFKYSWDTWISGDKYPIRLQLSDFWAERLTARPAVDDQIITSRGKDDNLFEGSVNSIDEIARWVSGRCGEVIALSPEQLRNKVKKYAQECLNAHNN